MSNVYMSFGETQGIVPPPQKRDSRVSGVPPPKDVVISPNGAYVHESGRTSTSRCIDAKKLNQSGAPGLSAIDASPGCR